MVELSQNLHKLQHFKALVLGDFFLDTYTHGRVKRISPEAPVPVMEVLSQEARPGGAGNVVLNLQALGAHVFCMGRIGADAPGRQLSQLLSQGLLVEEGYATPVKNRLIADSQQLLRVDFETISSLDPILEERLIEQLETEISQVQVVALSDYGKGFLTNRLIQSAIHIAKKRKVPVIVDPKGTDFTKYAGATILKPNLSEAYAAAKLGSSASLDLVAREIFARTTADFLLITRSEAGMSLFDAGGCRTDFPVVSREVKDVTGAGDTVLAVLALALANRLDMASAVRLSNIAAGIAIERLGCVQVTLSDLAKRLLQTDHRTKVFDENHTYALRQVLQGKKYVLLALSCGQEMTRPFFRAMRNFAQKGDSELVLYVSDLQPDDEFVFFLSSLNEVDYIVLQSESVEYLCNEIDPDAVYTLVGDDLVKTSRSPKEILQSLICK